MPIYEYQCDICGPFSEARPMAASALPSACPRCAALSPRVLSATASIGPRGRRGRRTEPSVVAVPDRREPSRRQKEMDPLRAARAPATDRPWMVGH